MGGFATLYFPILYFLIPGRQRHQSVFAPAADDGMVWRADNIRPYVLDVLP